MSVLYITELSDFANTNNAQPISIPSAGGPATQTVAISGSSASSAAFQPNTKFVRLNTDSVCSIAFGTSPTATTSSGRMAANQTEYWQVPLGQSFKVAVISNT